MAAVLNGANEEIVASFLNKQISFTKIPELIHSVMDKHICINKPSLEDIIECDKWARVYSKEMIAKC